MHPTPRALDRMFFYGGGGQMLALIRATTMMLRCIYSRLQASARHWHRRSDQETTR